MNLVNETMFQDPEVKAKANGRKLPSGRKRIAYKKMFMGLLYLGIFVVLGGSNNYAVALTPGFAKKSLSARYDVIIRL